MANFSKMWPWLLVSRISCCISYGEALNNILRKIGFIDVIAHRHLGSYHLFRHLKLILRNIQPKHEKIVVLLLLLLYRGYSQFKNSMFSYNQFRKFSKATNLLDIWV
jgi:hypothetical protein